jgi:aryl-alcohol dehydrogenase-like predicted oxidoreductase
MRKRRFGNTDLEVSEVTFGAMRFVPGAKGNPDEAEGRRALLAALDAGIDTIHSSHEYGTRYALDQVLRDHPKRHEIKHVIKVQVPDYAEPVFDPAKFRAQIEEGLKDLHTDCIAIAQHLQRGVPKDIIYDERGDPPRIAAMPAVNDVLMETLEKLRDEGKVAYLATFPHTPGFARKAIASGVFDGMVAFFNLVETEYTPLFDDMKARGMGFFSMRPFREGVLTDKRARRDALPADDPHRGPATDTAYRRFEALQRELEGRVASWNELAVKFSLAHPLIASVIVSMNTVEQVEGVLKAADGNYPDPTFINHVHEVVSQA